jgi:DNA processing protein
MTRMSDGEAHAAALAGLPGMTPVRLAKVLDGFGPPTAWRAIRAGAHPGDPGHKFASDARKTEVNQVEDRYRRAGVQVLLPGDDRYPSALVGDPGAPAVLFAVGKPKVTEGRPRVGIVGTRSATHYGRQVASDLASELAAAGVTVVSGLARGIDGAAHAGVLRGTTEDAAPPVAVVGTGLDVVYPASSRELWSGVAARGVVFSESPLGTRPLPGVFPARNRIIAALSDVVVVVESHYGGGSLYTAEAAARRSIPVCAVPGSVHSRASEGSNALLVDGCIPVRDATDVLVALSLARAGKATQVVERDLPVDERDTPVDLPPKAARSADATRAASTHPARAATSRHRAAVVAEPAMDTTQRAVWEALDSVPTAFETILIRTDLSIPAAAEACERLVDRGLLIAGAGWWSKK